MPRFLFDRYHTGWGFLGRLHVEHVLCASKLTYQIVRFGGLEGPSSAEGFSYSKWQTLKALYSGEK